MTGWINITGGLRRLRRRRHDPAAGLGDLEAALAGEACPICARTGGADERWLDHFLYEGYLERDVMRRVARAGGFCAHHARRTEAIGLSATVALVYLSLIDRSLPLFAATRERRSPAVMPLAAPVSCEACAQANEVERRECFFLALLLTTRGSDRYGSPAIVCMPHLPRLIQYLDDRRTSDILAIHRDAAAALAADPACEAADRVIRLILGPPLREPLQPERNVAEFAGDADPVGRLRHRLRHLPSCAVCAEIDDACAEWLQWLARPADNGDDLTDVLPLCRDHVWQARTVAGRALAPALAATVRRETEDRLDYATMAREPGRGARLMPITVRRTFSGASARRAVVASLRRGRECPLCRRAREAGERAVALLHALLEDAGGRRAFEDGYGLCVRHASQALMPPHAPAFGDTVAATMHARLTLLRWELEEQLRRGAWQARPERRGIESAAWLKAGARFAGTVRLAGRGA